MRWPTPITLIPFFLSTHSCIVSGNRHPRAKTIPLPAALIISGIRSTATATPSFVGPMRTAIKVIQSSGSCGVIFRGKRRSACRGCLRLRSTSIRVAEDAQSTSATATQITNDDEDKPTYVKVHARILPESEWRNRVDSHSKTVKSLLSPGLLPSPSGSGSSRNRKSGLPNASKKNDAGIGSGLDPKHPIYNFLIEYYGLKGSKGVRRLMRWSPPPFYADEGSVSCDSSSVSLEIPIRDSSGVSFPAGENGAPSVSGVILENATLDDVVVDGALHLRGATFLSDAARISGILYCPALYFGSKDPSVLRSSEERDGRPPASAAAFLWYRSLLRNTVRSEPVLYCHGLHEWAMLYRPSLDSPPPPSSQYQSHLPLRVSQETINEQVERKGVRCTHIDALRFFAPEARKWNRFGRLDEATNDTDDDGGTMEECHDDDNSGGGGFDADEVAAPANGAKLSRVDQLRLEQKACLHANMDLFKMALRLQPFVSSELLIGALSVALRARTLDVEASPYDVSGYEGLAWGEVGCGEGRIAKETTRRLGAVEVETEEGRKLYQKRQMDVMKEGDIVRNELLRAYNSLLENVFCIDENVEIDETNE